VFFLDLPLGTRDVIITGVRILAECDKGLDIIFFQNGDSVFDSLVGPFIRLWSGLETCSASPDWIVSFVCRGPTRKVNDGEWTILKMLN
jgi:hypothetical protein